MQNTDARTSAGATRRETKTLENELKEMKGVEEVGFVAVLEYRVALKNA